MSDLTRDELLILSAVIQREGHPWRFVEEVCCMGRPRARQLRDRMLRRLGEAVIWVERPKIIDSRGRTYLRERYYASKTLPVAIALRAWVDGGRKTVPPIPLPDPTQEAPQPRVIRSIPGVASNHEDRVLEAVLRNPVASWRELVPVTHLSWWDASAARDNLEASDTLRADVFHVLGKRGRMRAFRALVPNEESAHVGALRKRYGLRNVLSADELDRLRGVTPGDWRAQVRGLLADG